MTKKEQTEMQALRDRVAQLEAERNGVAEPPKPMTGDEVREAMGGPTYDTKRALPAWFANEFYAIDPSSFSPHQVATLGATSTFGHTRTGMRIGTTGMGRPFRTRLDALLFVRHHAQEFFSKRLAQIDKLIATEKAAQTPTKFPDPKP